MYMSECNLGLEIIIVTNIVLNLFVIFIKVTKKWHKGIYDSLFMRRA